MNSFLSLRTCIPAALDYSVLSCRIIGHNGATIINQSYRQSSSSVNEGAELETTKDENSNRDYEINPVFENRNPRNLEIIGLARKQRGWKFQFPRKDFYNKLVFEKTSWHTHGMVEHTSGTTVVEATTREPSLQKHLTSKVDVNAAAYIGSVLGRRCLEAGIANLIFDEQPGDESSEKLQAFLKSVKQCGVELSEAEEIVPDDVCGVDYSRPHRVGERKIYRDDYQLE